MKYLLSYFIIIFLFTSCSKNYNLDYYSNNQANKKVSLIKKANNGNINAMLELNKAYLFPQTKEGLEFYNKWYELVLQSNDDKKILAFSKIIYKYKDMFINGKEKYYALLKRAFKLGNAQALYKFLKIKPFTYKTNETIDNIFAKPSKEFLMLIYNFFTSEYYNSKRIEKIEKLISKNNYYLNMKDKAYRYKHLYLSKHKYLKLGNEILSSKNTKAIEIVGSFLLKQYKYEKARKYFEKAIKLKTHNINTYLKLSKIYYRLDKREKNLEILKQAANKNSYKATFKILTTFDIYKRPKEKEIFIKTISKYDQDKRALSEYYLRRGKINQSNEILKELANKKDVDAIINLASRSLKKKDKRYNDEIKKWQNYILKTRSPYLLEKLKKQLKRYYYKEHKELIKKITQIQISNNNILTLRDEYKKAYIYTKLKKFYKEKLIKLQDVKSLFEIASKYRYKGKYDEAIKLYEMLAKKSSIKANKVLGGIYSSNKNYKDLQKALKYYKVVANSNDLQAIRNVVFYYLCGDCKKTIDKNIINVKKAQPYINKILKAKDVYSITDMAMIFQKGYYVKQDLKRAKKYYKLLIDLKSPIVYFNLAQLYKYEYHDPKTAVKYAKKGASLNLCTSKAQLGYFYQVGYGVEKDINKALKYYKECAKFQPYTRYFLGSYYFKKEEYKKAKYYFDMEYKKDGYESYSEERPKATLKLGEMYEKGLGVEKDIKEALKYYKYTYSYIFQAPNSLERKTAAFNIAQIYFNGDTPIKKDLQTAKEWFFESNSIKFKKRKNKR